MKTILQKDLTRIMRELIDLDFKNALEVEIIEFILPNGRQRKFTNYFPLRLKANYEAMKSCGARLTTEILTTMAVSVCIEHPDLGDYDMELTPIGPESTAAMVLMLERFDVEKFTNWESGMEDE